jgi:hypothetical protein
MVMQRQDASVTFDHGFDWVTIFKDSCDYMKIISIYFTIPVKGIDIDLEIRENAYDIV